MGIKTNREINDGAKVVSNIGKPGIYKFAVVSAEPSSKFVKKDDPEAPTLNLTVKVVQALDVPKVSDDKKPELIGKLHTDVIDLSLESKDKTREEMWNNKTGRVAHILTKVGVSKDAVLDAADAALAKLKSWDDYTEANAVLFAEGVKALLTDEVKKKTFYGKVVGSVFNGKPVCGFQGFNGFATDVESSFKADERQKINDYYASMEGQTPSAEGAPSGASAAQGGAF